MLGNEILLSCSPAGHQTEGIFDEVVYPGQNVEMVPGSPEAGGRKHWRRARPGADGARCGIHIVLFDFLQGRTENMPYAVNERGFIYTPVMGEEMNIRVSISGTGTGDEVEPQDGFMVDDTTGNFIPITGSPDFIPWRCMEDAPDIDSFDGDEHLGTLVHCMLQS